MERASGGAIVACVGNVGSSNKEVNVCAGKGEVGAVGCLRGVNVNERG